MRKPTVHYLHHGVCGICARFPEEWPEGDVWVRKGELKQAVAQGYSMCVRSLAPPLPETVSTSTEFYIAGRRFDAGTYKIVRIDDPKPAEF